MKKARRTSLRVVVSFLLVSFLSLAPDQAAIAKTYVFGVVPQQSAQKLAAKWSPIFRYLSKKTGHRIVFSTAKSIPEFERRLASGVYDFAYMNPYHFTVFNQAPGYSAIAKQKDKRIKGIVVVRKDSPLTSIDQLVGETLAFPSPAAFAASILPRAKLKSDGIKVKSRYVRSHDSVYLAISRGLFVAGGGVVRTLRNTDPTIQAGLRVLWTSQGFTPHAFATHPSVDPAVSGDIATAMIAMNNDPIGQRLLKSISFNAIQVARDEDWDDVRGLGIQLLNQMSQRLR